MLEQATAGNDSTMERLPRRKFLLFYASLRGRLSKRGIHLPDAASLVVIAATLLLFVGALFLKGLSQTMLLEAGVFLVSLKLILVAARIEALEENLVKQLARIAASLEERQNKQGQGVQGDEV